MSNKNPCVYCGSPAYGPGCPFAPSKVHFHATDPKKCVFCGSQAHGPGCPFNPHSKVHVHGIEFNSMVKESIDKGITLGFLMSQLEKPITEMKAYELGIIDSDGKKLKVPETAEEISAYGPLEEYIIGLKQTLGKKLEMIHSAIDVHLESVISTDEYAKICEATSNIKEQFDTVGKEFNQIVTNAYNSGLSKATVEKMIVDCILEN